jgi:hypothetical protein
LGKELVDTKTELAHEKKKAVKCKSAAERRERLFGKANTEVERLVCENKKYEQLVAGLLERLVRARVPKRSGNACFGLKRSHTFAFTVSSSNSGRPRRRDDDDERKSGTLRRQEENPWQLGRRYRCPVDAVQEYLRTKQRGFALKLLRDMSVLS